MQPTLAELTKKHPDIVDELQAMATRRYASACKRIGALPQEPGDFAIQGDDTVVRTSAATWPPTA